jgi:phosphate uptake regulator
VNVYRGDRLSIETMNARKVLEMGGGTLLVSLPKEWTRKNGVKKGGILDVSELSGRKLLVQPIGEAESAPREFVVSYPGDDLNQVTNDITGAYLLGYDVIRIDGKKTITREDRTKLKSTLGRLVGLEIMDEDSKRMTVQFLLESSAIVPEKIVRRMSGLLEGMLRDTEEALGDRDPKLLALVGERDDEVDRLYFLLVRATRAAVTRPDVSESYGLTPVDLLDYRVLASFLESVGDAVTDLSRKLRDVQGTKELFREYAECVGVLRQMNDLATRAFISRRAGRPRTTSQEVNALAQGISNRLAEIAKRHGSQGETIAETLGTLDRVSRLLVDISDLAAITQPPSQ